MARVGPFSLGGVLLAELAGGQAGLVHGALGRHVDGVAGPDHDGDDHRDHRPGDGRSDSAAEKRDRRPCAATGQDQQHQQVHEDRVEGPPTGKQIGGGQHSDAGLGGRRVEGGGGGGVVSSIVIPFLSNR